MLRELNTALGAICSVTATTAQAVDEGSKILRIKGMAAKQLAAIEAVAAIEAATKGVSKEQLKAAEELLSAIEEK